MDYRVLLFVIAVLPFAGAVGQNTALDQFIGCVELQYGPDDLLINGRPYQPGNLRAEGHPYFQTEEWMPGTVYLSGKPYPGKELKYNMARQQLALKYERPNGTQQKVVASPLLVDSFRIGAHFFVNQSLILPGEADGGYLEKIFEDELSFFRFRKKVLSAPSNSKPYGKFSDLRAVFYLLIDGQAHSVTRRRDFLACFPEHRPQVKKYMKKHLPRWKKITDPQFVQLLKFCHDEI